MSLFGTEVNIEAIGLLMRGGGQGLKKVRDVSISQEDMAGEQNNGTHDATEWKLRKLVKISRSLTQLKWLWVLRIMSNRAHPVHGWPIIPFDLFVGLPIICPSSNRAHPTILTIPGPHSIPHPPGHFTIIPSRRLPCYLRLLPNHDPHPHPHACFRRQAPSDPVRKSLPRSIRRQAIKQVCGYDTAGGRDWGVGPMEGRAGDSVEVWVGRGRDAEFVYIFLGRQFLVLCL